MGIESYPTKYVSLIALSASFYVTEHYMYLTMVSEQAGAKHRRGIRGLPCSMLTLRRRKPHCCVTRRYNIAATLLQSAIRCTDSAHVALACEVQPTARSD